MKFISICSGVEAASVAFEPLGWKALAFSEIEKFPSAVLNYHYPSVPNLGDMNGYLSWPEEIFAETDIIVGGPPCQAFSVAGLRKGLDDERGNLTLTYVKLIDHADEIRRKHGRSPVIVIYENVPGILSTKDNAFGCFLGSLSGEDCAVVPPRDKWKTAGCVLGGKRKIAWRTLDAQFFGVPQRRRRVFVIGSARNDCDPSKILFESDSLRRDNPPSREKRERVTTYLERGVAYGGTDGECSDTVTSKWHKGSGGPSGDECGLFVAHKVYETHPADSRVKEMGAVCQTVTSRWGTGGGNVPLVQAYSLREDAKANNFSATPLHVTPALQALRPSVQSHHAQTFIVDRAAFNQGENAQYEPKIEEGDTMPTLVSRGPHAVMNEMAVRRLTPVECERLQGFPDNYTNISWNNKEESPDSHRYKAMGNSMAVPVMRWIGQRIEKVENGLL